MPILALGISKMRSLVCIIEFMKLRIVIFDAKSTYQQKVNPFETDFLYFFYILYFYYKNNHIVK